MVVIIKQINNEDKYKLIATYDDSIYKYLGNSDKYYQKKENNRDIIFNVDKLDAVFNKECILYNCRDVLWILLKYEAFKNSHSCPGIVDQKGDNPAAVYNKKLRKTSPYLIKKSDADEVIKLVLKKYSISDKYYEPISKFLYGYISENADPNTEIFDFSHDERNNAIVKYVIKKDKIFFIVSIRFNVFYPQGEYNVEEEYNLSFDNFEALEDKAWELTGLPKNKVDLKILE